MNETKQFQSLDDGSKSWKRRARDWPLVVPVCWHPASPPGPQGFSITLYLRGQMPWHLDPGLVSNHQHVLALREMLWASQYTGPGALSGADCWPWWSLISIIHYPRPADKSGSHRGLPLNCTLRKRWWATCEYLWCQDSRGRRWCNRNSAGYSHL